MATMTCPKCGAKMQAGGSCPSCGYSDKSGGGKGKFPPAKKGAPPSKGKAPAKGGKKAPPFPFQKKGS